MANRAGWEWTIKGFKFLFGWIGKALRALIIFITKE